MIKNFVKSHNYKGKLLNLQKKNLFVQIFPLVIIFFFWSAYDLQFGSIITKDQVTVLPFRLAEKITVRETGGKSSQKYYRFEFENYQKPFQFLSSDYRYASFLPNLLAYAPGDTIYAAVLKEDIEDLNNITNFSNNNRIISLQVNNRSTIDYDIRYKNIKASKKRLFDICAFAILANVLILAGISKFGKHADPQ